MNATSVLTKKLTGLSATKLPSIGISNQPSTTGSTGTTVSHNK